MNISKWTSLWKVIAVGAVVFMGLWGATAFAGPFDLLRENTCRLIRKKKQEQLAKLPKRFIMAASKVPGVRKSAGLHSLEFIVLGNPCQINHALVLFHGRAPRHLGLFCLGTEKKGTKDRRAIEGELKSANEGAIVLSVNSKVASWPGFSGDYHGQNGATILALCHYLKRFNDKGQMKFHLGALGCGCRPLYSLFCHLRKSDGLCAKFLDCELATVSDHDACYTESMVGAYRWLIKRTKDVQVNFIHCGRPVFEMQRRIACRFHSLSSHCALPSYRSGDEKTYLRNRIRFWSSKSHALSLGGQLARAFFGIRKQEKRLCMSLQNGLKGKSEGNIIEEERILRVDRKPL